MQNDYNRKLSGGQMPANYHPDDAMYIDGKLSMIGIEERGKLCSAYAKCYRGTYAAEPNEVRKDGKARREANTRLREYINKKFLRKMGQYLAVQAALCNITEHTITRQQGEQNDY